MFSLLGSAGSSVKVRPKDQPPNRWELGENCCVLLLCAKLERGGSPVAIPPKSGSHCSERTLVMEISPVSEVSTPSLKRVTLATLLPSLSLPGLTQPCLSSVPAQETFVWRKTPLCSGMSHKRRGELYQVNTFLLTLVPFWEIPVVPSVVCSMDDGEFFPG